MDAANMPKDHPDRPFFEKRAMEAIDRDFEASLRARGIGAVARHLLQSTYAEEELRKSRNRSSK